MKGSLYLAWRYLAHHRVKTTLLVFSITLIFFIPVGLNVLVRQSEEQLTARAEATPLLIGKKGSPLELTLNSLYFAAKVPERMEYGHVEEIARSGLADPIPLYVRFHARKAPIVGTTLLYFEFRGLKIAAGRQIARLGECVVGAALAKERGIVPGDHVESSPEETFNLAGVYSLRMAVTGVLEHSNSPDDHAIFVDVRTAWVIEGLAHGHQDLADPAAASGVLRKEGEKIIANASVRQYQEITEENVETFHFHGVDAEMPITALIAVPRDHKAQTILMGRYEGEGETHQIIEPRSILSELLETVLTIQAYVVAALAIVGTATLLNAGLVFFLSLRLRRREIETMRKIGAARSAIAGVILSEIVLVLVLSALFAGALTWVTSGFGGEILRSWVR